MRRRWSVVCARVSPFAFLFVLGGVTLAAEEGFVGAWRLDVERSDPYGQGQQTRPLPNIDMTVTLYGDNVGVERLYTVGMEERGIEFTYVTDGKPHDLPSIAGSRSTRARWKKNKLVVSYTLARQTQRGPIDLDINETWSVSEDGDELTIVYVTRAAQRAFNRKEIYVRQ